MNEALRLSLFLVLIGNQFYCNFSNENLRWQVFLYYGVNVGGFAGLCGLEVIRCRLVSLKLFYGFGVIFWLTNLEWICLHFFGLIADVAKNEDATAYYHILIHACNYGLFLLTYAIIRVWKSKQAF